MATSYIYDWDKISQDLDRLYKLHTDYPDVQEMLNNAYRCGYKMAMATAGLEVNRDELEQCVSYL